MALTPAAETTPRNGVPEYLCRLSALYAEAEAWLDHAGFSCLRKQTSLNEAVGGRYHAPRLLIRTPDGRRVAELEPVGAHVVGAYGRVDLCGAFDRIPIVYLVRGGPGLRTRTSGGGATTQESVTPLFRGVDRDGWYALEREAPSRARHIDRHHFVQLVRRVSEHALQEQP
jgi:hypothetical protein